MHLSFPFLYSCKLSLLCFKAVMIKAAFILAKTFHGEFSPFFMIIRKMGNQMGLSSISKLTTSLRWNSNSVQTLVEHSNRSPRNI